MNASRVVNKEREAEKERRSKRKRNLLYRTKDISLLKCHSTSNTIAYMAFPKNLVFKYFPSLRNCEEIISYRLKQQYIMPFLTNGYL